jgi:hypothetical protein
LIPIEINTYQDSVKSRRASTALHVTEHSDPRVLVQFLHHHLTHFFGGNGLSLSVNGTFSHDDDVQPLTGRPFLQDVGAGKFIITESHDIYLN